VAFGTRVPTAACHLESWLFQQDLGGRTSRDPPRAVRFDGSDLERFDALGFAEGMSLSAITPSSLSKTSVAITLNRAS
jgi:hypothetical protein